MSTADNIMEACKESVQDKTESLNILNIFISKQGLDGQVNDKCHIGRHCITIPIPIYGCYLHLLQENVIKGVWEKNKVGNGICIIGGIMLTVAGVCFIPKLQKKLANKIYRYQMEK